MVGVTDVVVEAVGGGAVVAGAVAFMTLYASHKIGGPLFRFKANLEQIGSGDLTLRTKLRDDDQLKSFTDAMNSMTESLGEKVIDAKKAQEDLNSSLEGVKSWMDESVKNDIDQAMAELENALDRFKVV